LIPPFAHKGRTATIMIRGQILWFIGEIHPFISSNFDCTQRIGFFELNADMLAKFAFNKVKTQDISTFQENNFDLNFIVDKKLAWIEIQKSIKKTNPILIQKVELLDIYEDETRFPGKRSITYKVFIQSAIETLDDAIKSTLIKDIIANVEKVGWSLRS
jgi:phenylalanyl-tRNA synthetase beta chain